MKETNTYHPNYRIWVICLSIKIKTKLNKPQIPSIVEIKEIEGWRGEGGVHVEKRAMQFHLLYRPEGSHWSKLRCMDTAIHWINLNSLERNHLSLYLSSIALFLLYS